MRRMLLLLTVVVLILPLGASAKGEITQLRVCGASACRIVTDKTSVHAFMVAIINHARGRSAPPKSPYFTIRPERTKEWQTSWPRYVYVPAARMIRLQLDQRSTPEWRWLGRDDWAVRKLVRGLTPFARQPWSS
jgi:hypothetical protein